MNDDALDVENNSQSSSLMGEDIINTESTREKPGLIPQSQITKFESMKHLSVKQKEEIIKPEYITHETVDQNRNDNDHRKSIHQNDIIIEVIDNLPINLEERLHGINTEDSKSEGSSEELEDLNEFSFMEREDKSDAAADEFVDEEANTR